MGTIKYSEEDIGRMILQFDKNGSGRLEFEEFKQVFQELKIEPLDIEDRVLFGLSQEHKRLTAISSMSVSLLLLS